MELRGEEGTRFELELERPGFAHDAGDGDDWLVVGIRVSGPQGDWRARFPCLHTWEAEDLARWLELVADDEEIEPLLEFAEPNLAFEKRRAEADRVTLRVYLRAEFRPPWATGRAAGGGSAAAAPDGGRARIATPADAAAPGPVEQAFVDLTLPRDTLRMAAARLRRQLALPR